MRLHDLAPPAGAKHRPKRVGRGTGSGHGNSATRGTKGQLTKENTRPGFEGGQTPLYIRMRKQRGRGKGAMPRGMYARAYSVINVGELQKLADRLSEGEAVTPKLLRAQGRVKKLLDGLRVLGEGELTASLKVYAHHFTAAARTKIEAAGGEAILLPPNAFEPAAASTATKSGEVN